MSMDIPKSTMMGTEAASSMRILFPLRSKYVISVNPPQTRAQIRAENAARIAKRKANA